MDKQHGREGSFSYLLSYHGIPMTGVRIGYVTPMWSVCCVVKDLYFVGVEMLATRSGVCLSIRIGFTVTDIVLYEI